MLSPKNNIILSEVKKFLSAQEYTLLILFYRHHTLEDICKKFKVSRVDVFLRFIHLGKKLAIYELNGGLLPKEYGEEYVRGFNDCRDQIIKVKAPIIKRIRHANKQARTKKAKRRN